MTQVCWVMGPERAVGAKPEKRGWNRAVRLEK